MLRVVYRSILLLLLLPLCFLNSPVTPAQHPLVNPDDSTTNVLLGGNFEEDFKNKPDTWSRQRWGETTTYFHKVTDNPHSGKSAIRMSTKDVKTGGSRFRQLINVKVGGVYKAVVWLRGDSGIQVRVCVEAELPPGYKPCAGVRTVTMSPDWKKVEFKAVPRVNAKHHWFTIRPLGDGAIYIDDAHLEDITAEEMHNLTPPDRRIEKTFFGLEFRSLFKHKYWPELGQGLIRIWGSYAGWNAIQPSNDSWNFSAIDRHVDHVKSNCTDCEILLKLGITPKWAASDPDSHGPWDNSPGGNSMPQNINDWKIFVRKVAERYKTRIQYYEIWNEVNIRKFWKDGMENMLKLSKVAYEVIKSVDPNATVLMPNFTVNGYAKFEEYLKLGGAQYADMVSFHIYMPYDSVESSIKQAIVIKDIMLANGADLPIWNDEAAISGKKLQQKLTSNTLGGLVARAYIVNWLYGFENFTYYFYGNHGDYVWLSQTNYHTLTPGGMGYAEIANWLTGTHIKKVQVSKDRTWIVQLTMIDGRDGYLLWKEQGAQYLNVPLTWKISERWDMLGNRENITSVTAVRIDDSPLLLVSDTSVHNKSCALIDCRAGSLKIAHEPYRRVE